MAATDTNGRDDKFFEKDYWYAPEITNLSDSTRQLLEVYSKIPSDEVVAHVTAIREKAWAVHRYPCIGQWRFLDLSIGKHQLYPEVLERLKTDDQTFLDLGCAFGQDIRRLAADGVDTTKLYGSDLRLEFVDLGYELFRDKDILKSKFIEADVFATDSVLDELEGKVDIVHAASFFHLFSRPDQKVVAHRVLKLLKQQPGSLLLGRQVGDFEAGEKPKRRGSGTHFRHNENSWKQLWTEVGEEAGGVILETKVVLKERWGENVKGGGPRMEFSVRRL